MGRFTLNARAAAALIAWTFTVGMTHSITLAADDGILGDGDLNDMFAANLVTYTFDPALSTVLQTGGFAGVHETLTVTGTFSLGIDFLHQAVVFTEVDAALSGSIFCEGCTLNGVFNLTGLTGRPAIDREGPIVLFEGPAEHGGVDNAVRVVLRPNPDLHTISLTGSVTPPPFTADFFSFNLDAVANLTDLVRPGDFNGDGVVDHLDIDLIHRHIREHWSHNDEMDLNTDGGVDLADAAMLVGGYLETVPGDVNLDRLVNIVDLSRLAQHFGQSDRGWEHGDNNGDGLVNIADLSKLASYFGYDGAAGGEASGGAVPAPPAIVILAAGLAVMRRRSA